ncbi:hypothetical protein SEA_ROSAASANTEWAA_24 [Streptomyces phage RosaAsantewaa]|nr:hypothetical protein SEA_ROSAASANTEWAA_24 [Streptomyces phage RosaAsantewaa]
MDVWQVVLVSAGSVVASSGFWTWVLRKSDKKSAVTQLMMGLAYIELLTLGQNYVNRGSISMAEYEDYRKYFYEPYKELGGNGSAERMMEEVKSLPIVSHGYAETAEVRNREGEHISHARVVARSEEASVGR